MIWLNQHPQLVAVSDVHQDYSLHESPVSALDGGDDTNENPNQGSAWVLDLIRRYLALHPTSGPTCRSFFSIVIGAPAAGGSRANWIDPGR